MKQRRIYSIFIFAVILLLGACGKETLPKPKAMLKLSYPKPSYIDLLSYCGYSFEVNKQAIVKPMGKQGSCWYNIEYPTLKATMYISYFKVNNNLDSLLRDAQNLTQEHVVKADEILQEPYDDRKNKVYGMFYEVRGDAASQSQFYATDSVHHFISGSVYFKARPNYDSILPAANYMKGDMRKLVETIRWNE
ncbi:gliding motility lipoprotein GldD [Aquimarina hainanensis]|uniref:Gliding motility lipoprotein GldD n=1 Tax=Aquimarina hainanensis TaxID=1578017 RepID=A0ABW5N5J0_9FLAO|nr:gliding motility lipoprotein GldD [Aquimarina sp. TRL1]QKX04483.1 gliding motility lipoprotein GldD [Aquimarina sp. TRL1]